MPEAARVADVTGHGPPLNPGPGSPDVMIGFMPAWRALPQGMGAGIEKAADTMKDFMSAASLTPAETPSKLADVFSGLGEDAGKAAGEGAPGAAAGVATASTTAVTANVALSTAYATAAAVPGGEPAARTAFTEGIKAAMAGAASAAMSAMAGVADMHICPIPCPIPPHGPGFVTKGSKSVFINGLPAARKGDKVFEACGGSDPIQMGCPTVLIGDEDPSGGGGGAGGGAGQSSEDSQDEAAEESSEPTYAETQPAEQPPGQSPQQVDTGTHWIEIELVDEADQPVVGERYAVRLPDGKEAKGRLNAKGQMRITGIKQAGTCGIKFPDLDLAAWERWRPTSSSATGTPTTPHPPTSSATEGGANAQPVPEGPPSAGGRWKKVIQGECISSLARDSGHFWETIWNHASNTELKRRRLDPNVLLPRDAVFIPEKRPKEETGPTDQHHKFLRRGEPSKLLIRLLVNDEPLANLDYELEIDGKVTKGKTDAEGCVEIPIPGNARKGMLRVHEDEYVHEFPLILGKLDPVTALSGVQQRLHNLGFDCGPIDGRLGPRTKAAIEKFQARHKLKVTGEPDQPTRDKLVQEHES